MAPDLFAAIDHLRRFSLSWTDDEEVDTVSHLTGADLKLIVKLLDAGAPTGASALM